MDIKDLREEAEFRLGANVLAEIQQWYFGTVHQPQEYVVFVVRRSYLLALMMECLAENEDQMGKRAKFLTDAGLMLHCRELAERYRREKRFPSILLCDDILIHGRNINHFLINLEKRLAAELPECTEDEIERALGRAVKIHVYVRADAPLILLGRYELNLSYLRSEKPAFWRKLSNDISSLIIYAGMAYAVFVYSDWLEENQYRKLDLREWKDTTYQGIEQNTYVEFVGEPEQVKAVYTLRLIPNRFGGARLIPFVFLPNLGTEESHLLLEYIVERMLDNGFTNEECQVMREWEEQEGKRSINELIGLILGCVILRDYEKKADILGDAGMRDEEIQKLVRNYRQSDWEKTEKFISKIIVTDLFTKEELTEILLDVISDERRMFSLSDGGNEVKDEEKREIVDRLEDYFYAEGEEQEKDAYEMSKRLYSEHDKRTERVARACCFLMDEMAEGYTQEQGKYMVAYFLQMMDAGVLSLSSYAPSRVKVVGYTQYAKAGEQSLALEPLQVFEYIPLLARIQIHCECVGEDLLDGFWEYTESLECGLSPDTTRRLEEFIWRLGKMGQRPADWNENYLFRIDDQYHIKRAGRSDITDYIQKQKEHVRDYLNYLQKRNYVR